MAMKVICAWCGQVLRDLKSYNNSCGIPEPVSHSICLTCKKKVLDETEQYLKQTTKVHEKNLMERRP